MTNKIKRFPRTDVHWKGIPRLDLSKVKKSSWLIDSFLAKGGIQLIYGAAGSRKTTTMLLAARAVSRGEPFLGKKTRQRSVLYLDYENPFDVVKSYCEDLKINPSRSEFAIWDRSAEPTALPDDERLEEFIRCCKKRTGHAPWIIFDSWTSLLKSGESGNAIGEAAPIFKAIRHLCDIGATCTIIDHTGKKGDEPIGTSAKMTQMSSSFHFSVDESTIGLDGRSARSVIRAESNLKRYTPDDFGTFSIEVKAAMNAEGEWHTVSVEPTTDKAVLALAQQIASLQEIMAKNPAWGQEQVVSEGNSRGLGSKSVLRQLVQEGIGRYWKTVPSGSKKIIFRVLKASAREVVV